MAKFVCELLLIEDDEPEIERFERALQDENEKKDVPIQFKLSIARSSKEAFEILANRRVDCAVVDLRVPISRQDRSGSDPDAAAGNDLLRTSLGEHAIPHILHSAHTAELDEDVGPYVEIIEKEGGDLPRVFGWHHDKAGLMSAMKSIRKNLMSETAFLFKRSILPQWSETQKFNEGDEELHKILLRQIVSYLSEYLSLPLYGAPKHHLHEAYFKPSLREDRLHTGDILKYDNAIYIIVTPQCNMVWKYPDNILIAKCNEIENQLTEIRDLLRGNKKNVESAKKRITDLANQQVPISKHYLPPCGGDGPWQVDFSDLVTVPSVLEKELLAGRIASLAPQFIPNLIQRFSAYLGRHGQPDLDPEELQQNLMKV